MAKKVCYEEKIVPGTLRNYNKYRDEGWHILWSGEGKFNFRRKIQCPKEGK